MIYNIQTLRAAAATLVVWAHLREMFPETSVLRSLPSGLAGVDLFFVISGFIMVASTLNRPITPMSFLIKRAARVAPLYYVFTLVVFGLTLVIPSIFKSSVADPVQLLASFLFFPVFKSADRIYPVYYLGWTLNYEMFFYLVFSAGLLLKGGARYAVPMAAIVLLASLGFFHDFEDVNAALYTFTRPILLDFVMGMLIALSVPRLKIWGERAPASVLAALVVGVVGLATAERFLPQLSTWSSITPPTDTVLIYGIWAALIVAAAVSLELSGRHVRNKLLLLVGDSSYSLYLSHYFVVAAAIVLCNRLNASIDLRIGIACATFVACIAVGIGCYFVLERTLIELFRRKPRKAVA